MCGCPRASNLRDNIKVEARADSDRAEIRAGSAKNETKIDQFDRDISTLYHRNFEDPR